MAQSGREISVKNYSIIISGTCPVSLPSSCLPTATYSIGTDPVGPVCPGTQDRDPRSIVVQTTVPNHKNTDDPKKGFEESSDPRLRKWVTARLPRVESNKEDIEWRTLKHPGLGLILVGIMVGVICWIGRRKYPAKDSFERLGFTMDDLRDFDSYRDIDEDWAPCGSIKTESDSSSDEKRPDPDEDLALGEIPPRHRKMPKESPGHSSMAGNSHTDPQPPIFGNLGSATALNLQSRGGLIEEQGKDVIESP